MRRLIAGFAILTACSSTSTTTSTSVTPASSSGAPAAASAAPVASSAQAHSGPVGAASPRQAVVGFLAAVKDTNLQAMGAIFGGPSGPANDRIPTEELHQRELIMVCYLANTSYRIVSERPSADGSRIFSVEMKLNALTRSTDFTAAQGPESRWYMMAVELEPMQDFCGKRAAK